jgi:hypothetical protein
MKRRAIAIAIAIAIATDAEPNRAAARVSAETSA